MTKAAATKPDLLTSPIPSTLKQMTVPMVYGVVLLLLFGLVDTFFVGLLGTEHLAAISFTFPVTFTLLSLNIGLGIGTSATIARYLGAGEQDQAKDYGTGAIILAVILVGSLAVVGWFTITPVFSVLGATEAQLPYIREYMVVWYFAGIFLAVPMVGNSVLRASGDTKTPSVIMALGGFINAVLDPLFIFGWGPVPEMGIQGAAWATLVAWVVSCGFIIYILAVQRKLITPRLLNWQEFKIASQGVLKIGVPAAGANMLTPVANGVLTSIVAKYGSTAVATWGVGSRIESIASVVILALSMSLPPIVSQNFGAGKIQRVTQAYSVSIKFIMAWQLVVFAVIWLTSPWIAEIFTDDPQVASLIQLFLSIVPIAYGLQGIIILTNSSMNAMHRPMMALALSVVRLFVFFVPFSYVGAYYYQFEGMLWAGVVANCLTATVAFLWFRNLLNNETTGHNSALKEQPE